MTDTHELYAIKYGHHPRTASHNFIGGDPHDGPMPLDYFIWLARNRDRVFVIDTGFNGATAAKRGRTFIKCPTETLRVLGVEAVQVQDVIITHLHYDHVGCFDLFPNTRYHLQDLEMRFATGRYMANRYLREAYDVENVVGMVREIYKERVIFHQGDVDLAPGISLHLVGGHTMGLQVVRVKTKRGQVVLASDASHLYANMDEGRPFPIVYNVGDMVQGWSRVSALADSPEHVIPGHDPEVLRRYPSPSPDLQGLVAQLDVKPEH